VASTWISYNELAWIDDILTDPADCETEVSLYVDLIKHAAAEPPRTLLHLGSGAGWHDLTFKQHFEVTGVDLSCGMLERARRLHPDIEYLEGDMRTLRLDRGFDAVTIPDSIDFMASVDDLRQAIQTAARHLKAGGVLLVVANPAETFRGNNFVYTGERDDVQVTLFENNYINRFRPNTYESTLAYFIRRQGELTIQTENQVLGLFPRDTWLELFREAGLTIQQTSSSGFYERYLLGEGEYTRTVFVASKS
jgi:ubiquinone/menaquinone biosynthesis C-methylase UbiE